MVIAVFLLRRGPGYFEVDVDVNSSSVANTVVGMVQVIFSINTCKPACTVKLSAQRDL